MNTPVRPLGSRRLKQAALAICDRRIKFCKAAEARYAAMARAGGGILGTVELARQSEATERSARMEVEHIRRLIAELPEGCR